MSSPSKAASTASPSPKKPPSSSSASSIGKNSSDDDDNATAASDQGVDQLSLNVNALEDALPIKKGISEHHGGKLKSYANLADAAGDSSIVKPEDAYSKKRKNKIARGIRIGGLGREPVNKKQTTASRTTAPPSTNVASGTGSQDDDSTKDDSDPSSGDE